MRGSTDVNYETAVDAYTRDTTPVAPHDLYTSTDALWRAGRDATASPAPLFTYAPSWDGRAKRIGSAHLPFSSVSDVWWTWSRRADAWLRCARDGPARARGRVPVDATNVVDPDRRRRGQRHRRRGRATPRRRSSSRARGRAFVLRDGRHGRWRAGSAETSTTSRRIVTKDGTRSHSARAGPGSSSCRRRSRSTSRGSPASAGPHGVGDQLDRGGPDPAVHSLRRRFSASHDSQRRTGLEAPTEGPPRRERYRGPRDRHLPREVRPGRDAQGRRHHGRHQGRPGEDRRGRRRRRRHGARARPRRHPQGRRRRAHGRRHPRSRRSCRRSRSR